MDGLLNLVIVLIPLAIFIGRAITSAQRKFQSTSPEKKIDVPKKEEDTPFIFSREKSENQKEIEQKIQATATRNEAAAKKKRQTPTVSVPLETPSLAAKESDLLSGAKTPVAPAVKTTQQGGFALNLSYLSPLKQAVVMAEVLGAPKGLKGFGGD